MFFKYGILKNSGLPWHIALAGILIKFFMIFMNAQLAFISVLIVALAYEVYQWATKAYLDLSVPEDVDLSKGKLYWQKKRFKLDAYLDVLGAAVGAIFSII